MKIIWSPLAIERLEEISDYIAMDNPRAAREWLDSVFDKVDLLKGNPQMGRVVPETNVTSIREIVFSNHRIIYRTFSKELRILTVRSFKQILPIKEVDSES